MIIVVMGVCGSGKTTVGSLLAAKMGCCFADADQFHSDANKAKMSQSQPLTDEDRMPWLLSIHDFLLKRYKAGESAVVTCSALKKSYRTMLQCGSLTKQQTGDTSDTVSDSHHLSSVQVNEETTCNDSGVPSTSQLDCENKRTDDIQESLAETEGNICEYKITSSNQIGNLQNYSKGGNPGSSLPNANSDMMTPVFVHLTGSKDVLENRLSKREGHFMPKSMLQSQLQTLEPLQSDELGISVNVNQHVDDIVKEILSKLAE